MVEIVLGTALAALGAGIAVGFAGLGSGLGQGMAAAGSVGAVAEDGDQGVRKLHNERRSPEADNVHGVREIPFPAGGQERYRIDGSLPEEPQNEQHLEKLGEDRGQGSAADAHAEHEDEDRVQEYVGDGADHDRDHAEAGEAFRVDVWVHARRDHGKDRSEQIDPEVRDGVDERGFVRAEQD